MIQTFALCCLLTDNAHYHTRSPFTQRQSTRKQDIQTHCCSCDAHIDPMALIYKYDLDRCHTSNFLARVFSRDKIASVTWRVARLFNSRATLFPNRALFCATLLTECWLVSCHRCFCFASVHCTYSSFCLIYFNLFNLEMEWSDAKTMQLIEL